MKKSTMLIFGLVGALAGVLIGLHIRKGEAAMSIAITSPAFKEGASIPIDYTGQGKDTSPLLRWEGAPKEAKSFALICDDPDAPGKTWVHWVIWNIPAGASKLDQAVAPKDELADGTRQGKNDFGNIGYGGPMPPPGKAHRYYFKLYALNAMLDLRAGASKADLLKAMEGHILAQGQLMGTYKRQ